VRVEFIPAIVGALLLFLLLKDHGAASHHSTTTFREYLHDFFSLLRNRTLALILLVTVCRSVGQSTTTIFLPIYLREDLGYSAALVGLYISMSQVAGIGSQPLMGFMSDRFGHKQVMLPALALFALLLAMIPLADGKIGLAIVIFLLGFFLFSMQSILTSAAIEQAGHEVHSTVVSLIYASSFVGSLAPTLAGILSDEFGIKSTFYFSALLGVAAVVVLALTKMPRRVTPA
jgi:DHA1 family inner membrane transport protein